MPSLVPRLPPDSAQTIQSDNDTPPDRSRALSATTAGDGTAHVLTPLPTPTRPARAASLDDAGRPAHKSPAGPLDELTSQLTELQTQSTDGEGLAGVADAFRVDERDLKLEEAIGAGAFGTVRAARWGSTPVAVKILFHDSTVDDWACFKREIAMMSRLHHPNIAQFLGWSRIPELALVVELFERGSLEAYVPREKPGLRTTLSFCRDMARAVEYLHGRRPQIVVHRDLKPPNFLVSKALRVKLGDFGIARGIHRPSSGELQHRALGSADGSTARGPARVCFGPPSPDDGDRVSECELTSDCGTARFMAPEMTPQSSSRTLNSPLSTHGKASYDHAADIFSLALCYYFVWERKLPEIAGVVSVEQHRRAIEAGARPAFKRTPGVVRELVESMWALEPRDRASATEVCERLDRFDVLRPVFGPSAVVLGPAPSRASERV